MDNIRPVITDAHIQATVELATTIWKEHYTPIIGEKQVAYMLDTFQSETAIKDQINKGMKYFLIKDKEYFVGYFSFNSENDQLFISKLYVLKTERGRGFGKKALDFIENRATKQGLGRIALTVNKNNIDSIKAYQKMGFINIKSIVQDIGQGFVMDDYILEKHIL